MTTLLFLTVVVFGLTLAPAVPLTETVGEGALAALALTPRAVFPDFLSAAAARLALILFPFGAPAFRLGAAAAVLAGGAALLASRWLRQARGPLPEGPVLWALEEERRWSTAETVALLFWALAGPAWMAARGRWGHAVFLAAAALALERTWVYARTHRVLPAGAGGLAWGLTLSMDPRSILFLPLPWVFKALEAAPLVPKNAAPRRRLPGVLFAAALLVGFALPAGVIAAGESATAGQTVTALGRWLRLWAAAGETATVWPGQARDALAGFGLSAAVLLAVALAALWDGDRSSRRIAGVWLGAGVVVALAPAFVPWGPPPRFHELALLLWTPAVARGARVLFRAALPLALPVLFLIPVGLSIPFIAATRGAENPEALAGDVFRSTPPGEPLGIRPPAVRAAALYRQRVWGDRPDLRVVDGAARHLHDPAADDAAARLPAGFTWRFTSASAARTTSPATLSLGRIPFLLAESGLDGFNPGARAAAHHALGDAFFEKRAPDQAEVEYLQGLAHRPEDGDLYAALGVLFLDYGETARAAAALDRATRLGNPPPDVWRNSAKAEYQEGRLHRALSRLDTAARRFPTLAEVHMERAELLEKLDRPPDAARAWEEAAAQRPDDKTLHWRRTQAWLRAEEPLKAYRAVETYLSLDLMEAERRDGEAFRGLLLDALNRPGEKSGDASGGDQSHQNGSDALGAGGVDQ